jgi:hypothetical protein
MSRRSSAPLSTRQSTESAWLELESADDTDAMPQCPEQCRVLPGWNDSGGLRTGRFHGAISSPGTKAEGQSHPIPWRPRAQPSLARLSYPSKAWSAGYEPQWSGKPATPSLRSLIHVAGRPPAEHGLGLGPGRRFSPCFRDQMHPI